MTLEERNLKKAELVSKIDEVSDMEQLEELRKQLNEIETAKIEEPIVEERSVEQEAQEIEERSVSIEEIEVRKDEEKMEEKIEVRNSAKYINAYAEYVKTGKDEEVRSLLTENVEGTIAIPDLVYGAVKTAWDNETIMSLVKKTNLKGNLKVNFEISGTDAVIHTEGTGAVSEEELTEGIVTIVPAHIKKWISISDEVMSLRGEEFLNYIYKELTYKIVKKAADTLVGKIAALPQTATSTSPMAAKISVAPAMSTVAQAFANLSDEASNPVIIMNKLTYANFKNIAYANGYYADPFEGLAVKFNNTLKAYDAASSGDIYMIVGDLGEGALANLPNGDGVEFTFDQYSRKKEDLVEVLGKEYIGLGVITNKAFTLVAKPTV